MSLEFPDWVNPWKAADGKRHFSGSLALKKMERLCPLLDEPEGEARFEARFERDGLGLTLIRLSVEAELPLTCQASLERFKFPVSRQNTLVIVGEHDPGADLPDHYEMTTAEDGRIGFLQIVQDELILAVPQVPRRPGVSRIRYTTDPDERAALAEEERNRPFAALEQLMRGKQQQETDH